MALGERAGPSIAFTPDEDASLADNLESLGRAAAREIATVSNKAWNLALELYYYALRDPAMRKAFAAQQMADHDETTEVFRQLGASGTLDPAELEVVLNALAMGLAQRHTLHPSLVTEELFAKACRLLAQ